MVSLDGFDQILVGVVDSFEFKRKSFSVCTP
jgi:hypothetical protein